MSQLISLKPIALFSYSFQSIFNFENTLLGLVRLHIQRTKGELHATVIRVLPFCGPVIIILLLLDINPKGSRDN